MENVFKYDNNCGKKTTVGGNATGRDYASGSQSAGCTEADNSRFIKIFEKNGKLISYGDFSIPKFFNWYDNLQCETRELATVSRCGVTFYRLKYRRTKGTNYVCVNGNGTSKEEMLYDIITKLYNPKVFQQMMEAGGSDGVPVESSEKETTTIMDRAVEREEVSAPSNIGKTLLELCNTEMDFEFPKLTDRWERLKSGTIEVDKDFEYSCDLPKDLLKKSGSKTSASLAMFRNFVYSKLEIEMKVTLNCPHFGQGKLIVSWLPDAGANLDKQLATKYSMIQRPHVILDLNSGTEAVLRIPHQYRRTLIRNMETTGVHTGMQLATMCKFQMATFSQYVTGKDQPRAVPYQIFFRFVKADFCGLSYGVELQMDKILHFAGEISPEVKLAEKMLKRVGFIGNQDKPYSTSTAVVVPKPRNTFSSGVGISDSIPLTIDHESNVTTLPEYVNGTDPKTIADLTRMWGYHGAIKWKTEHAAGALLTTIDVTPCPRAWDKSTYRERMETHPTPLNFASSMFALYRGTLEYKFIMVGTPLHTGSIQFEISYVRAAANSDESNAVYTKTFDFGLERETTITVPYIYDTPWRRTCSTIQMPTSGLDGVSAEVESGTYFTLTGSQLTTCFTPFAQSVNFISKTQLTIRVINPLTPIDNVSKEMEIVCLVRGGSDYCVRAIVPSIFTNVEDRTNATEGTPRYLKQFPIYTDCKYNIETVDDQTKIDRGILTEVFKPAGKTEAVVTAFSKAVALHKSKEPVIKLQADFDSGPFVDSFHSTDTDLSFKTLMRRQYHFTSFKMDAMNADNVEVMGLNGYSVKIDGFRVFFLPIYVPNHYESFGNCVGPVASPLACLSTLFRHWRGGLNMTFVVKNSTNAPLYVSYIPNLGVKYYGNRILPSKGRSLGAYDLSAFQYLRLTHPAQLGFATEIMIPSVNNSISVRAPFDCYFNMCVNSTRVLRKDGTDDWAKYEARDEMTGHSGHFMLYCEDECHIDAFISVSDDFEMHNFIGNPKYVQNMVYQLDDTSTNEKQFFQNKHVSVATKRVSQPTYTVVSQMFAGVSAKANRAFDSIDEMKTNMERVGNQLGESSQTIAAETTEVRKEITKMSENSDKTMGAIRTGIEKISSAFDRVGDSTSQGLAKITELINPILEKLAGFLPDMERSNFLSGTIDIIFDLIILLRDFNLSTFCILVLKYIAKILCCNLNLLMGYYNRLLSLLKIKFGLVSKEQQSDTLTDKESESIFGFFTMMIANACKFTFTKEKKTYDYGSKLTDFVFDSRNVQYSNGVMSLFERVFRVFSAALKYCRECGMEGKESVLEKLKARDTEIVNFVYEVDEITNPAHEHIRSRPDVGAKIWKNYMYAKSLKRNLVFASGSSAARVIFDAIANITKFVEENWGELSSCPVRMEPRVYCFTGEPNCGKSVLSDYVTIDLLTQVGYKRKGVNPVFTRAPGRKHWDGYKNQPIIKFDDWMNISESERASEQISDLFELKSSCEFIPQMAAMSQKGKPARPLIISLLCNKAFPETTVQGIAEEPKAVWRRRDRLIEVKRKPEFANENLREMSESDSLSFEHLLFRFCNPTEFRENKLVPIADQWLSYSELMTDLRADFTKYFQEEKMMAERKMRMLCADLPDHVKLLKNPLELFEFRTTQMEEQFGVDSDRLPSHVIDKQVEEILEQVERMRSNVVEQAGWKRPPRVFKKKSGWENVLRSHDLNSFMSALILLPQFQMEWTEYREKQFSERNFENLSGEDRIKQRGRIYDSVIECKRSEFSKIHKDLPNLIEKSWICGNMFCKHGTSELPSCAGVILAMFDTMMKNRESEFEVTGWCELQHRVVDSVHKKKLEEHIWDEERAISSCPRRRTKTTVGDVQFMSGKFKCRKQVNGKWQDCGECTGLKFGPYIETCKYDCGEVEEIRSDVVCSCRDCDFMCEDQVDFEDVTIWTNDLKLSGIEFLKRKGEFNLNDQVIMEYTEVARFEEQFANHPFDDEIVEHRLPERYQFLTDFGQKAQIAVYAGDSVSDQVASMRAANVKGYQKKVYGTNSDDIRDDGLNQMFRDAWMERTDVMQPKIRARSHKISKKILAEIVRNPSKLYTDVNIANVTLEWGSKKIEIPEELLSMKHNLSIRKEFVKCTHCTEVKLIQWGNKKHHICTECRDTMSTCPYCTLNEVPTKFFKTLFISVIAAMLRENGKKAWRWIKSWWTSWSLMDAFFTASAVYMTAMAAIAGRVAYAVCMQDDFQDHKIFERKFDMIMGMRGKNMNPVCFHSLLQVQDDIAYEDHYWRWLTNGVINKQSVEPCEKNCSLFDGEGRRRYKEYCWDFTMKQRGIYRTSLSGVSKEDMAELMKRMPYFCRPDVLPHDYRGDHYEQHAKRRVRNTLQALWQGGMEKIGINPTGSILSIALKCVGAILSALVAIRGIFGLFGFVKSKFTREPEQQYGEETRHFLKHRSGGSAVKAPRVTSQGHDEQFEESLRRKITQNTLVFVIRNDKEVFSYMVATGIFGRVAIMPRHYMSALAGFAESGARIEIIQPYFPGMKIHYAYDDSDFVLSDSTDLCVFKAPKTINMFVNLKGYLATEADWNTHITSQGWLYRVGFLGRPNEYRKLKLMGVQKSVELHNGEVKALRNVLQYDYGDAGACGTLVMRSNHTRPIVAMHVAGTDKNSWVVHGFGIILALETFGFLDEFGNTLESAVDLEEDTAGDAKMLIDGKVKLQSLVKTQAVFLPTKTKILPSAIHKYDGEEPKTSPCFLSARDEKYQHKKGPLMAGIEKHGKLTDNFTTTELSLVTEALWSAKYAQLQPSIMKPQKLTVKEAIRGFSISGYDPMKLNTSMGYPWIFSTKKIKSEYVTIANPTDEIEKRAVWLDQETLDFLDAVGEQRRAGIIPFLPYIDELKDERRKWLKMMELGGTRVYCMASFASTVACRQNFLHFAAAYTNNRLELQHAVGIARDSPEWGNLAKKLLRTSNNIVTLDYSNFGPGYNAGVNASAHEILSRWTKKYVGGINATEIAVLGEEHYNSLHIAYDLCYRQLSGGPSGDGLTVVKNGLVNELYLLLAWMHLFTGERNDWCNSVFDEYFQNVTAITYGDDVIMAVSDECISWFNGITITNFFAKFGIVATDAEKSSDAVSHRTLLESTFLKSGFKPHPKRAGEWLAPMDKISITETPRWIKQSPDHREATLVNARMAVQLAYGHGKEYFNELREKINLALDQVGIPRVLITWEELDTMFFGKPK